MATDWPNTVQMNNVLQRIETVHDRIFPSRYDQTRAVTGKTNGKWKHYTFLYRVQLPGYNWMPNPTHFRVMLEETGPQGSRCGNALFDNVVIREAKVCSKGKTA